MSFREKSGGVSINFARKFGRLRRFSDRPCALISSYVTRSHRFAYLLAQRARARAVDGVNSTFRARSDFRSCSALFLSLFSRVRLSAPRVWISTPRRRAGQPCTRVCARRIVKVDRSQCRFRSSDSRLHAPLFSTVFGLFFLYSPFPSSFLFSRRDNPPASAGKGAGGRKAARISSREPRLDSCSVRTRRDVLCIMKNRTRRAVVLFLPPPPPPIA